MYINIVGMKNWPGRKKGNLMFAIGKKGNCQCQDRKKITGTVMYCTILKTFMLSTCYVFVTTLFNNSQIVNCLGDLNALRGICELLNNVVTNP